MQAFAAETAEAAAEHHGGVLSDPTFWVAVCFVIFFVLLGKKLFGTINTMLDQRAALIKTELEESARLRAEAQAMLDDFKKKQAEAAKDAEAIVRYAREEAERAEQSARTALDAAIARRRDQAVAKIAQAEAEAVREVRELAVSIAVAATRNVIASDVAGAKGAALIDRAIADLPQKLH